MTPSLPLRIEPTDPAVRRLTAEVIGASIEAVPTMAVRCRTPRCRAILGRVGTVGAWVLFTSSWAVGIDSPVLLDGQRHTLRGYLRRVRRAGAEVSGDDAPTDEIHSVLAVLNLPIDLPQDYPALLVRCAEHGDAVLGRAEVVAAARSGAPDMPALVAFPRRSYLPLNDDWLTPLAQRSRTQRHIRVGGTPRPPEQVRALLDGFSANAGGRASPAAQR